MGLELLEDESIEVGAEVVRRLHLVEPVRVALWLTESESGRTELYIALASTDSDTSFARGELRRILDELRSPWIDGMSIRLIGPTSQMAKEAHWAIARYPGRPRLRLGAQSFGSVDIESGYVYSLPQPANV